MVTPGKKGAVRTKADRAARWERARAMAADGYTSRQMADEFGIELLTLRVGLKQHQIDVPADRIVGRAIYHHADRIVEHMAIDADHLTADVKLIEFSQLSRDKLGDWIAAFSQAHKALEKFIGRLIKERKGRTH